MEYCICQRGQQQYFPSLMFLYHVTLSLFLVVGFVSSLLEPGWTFVMILAKRIARKWCCVASETEL